MYFFECAEGPALRTKNSFSGEPGASENELVVRGGSLASDYFLEASRTLHHRAAKRCIAHDMLIAYGARKFEFVQYH